jgi:Domain of unknown function (DUF397)
MTNEREATLRWRKSSYSGSGNNCVQVSASDPGVAVRDSKDPNGPTLVFSPQHWRTFVAAVKAGEFGLG